MVLDDDGRILMAHPFAAHTTGARVQSDGREWWGNCAWDAFGIVAALGLDHATVTAQGITLDVDGDEIHGDAVFECSSPPPTGGTTSATPERRCGSSGRRRTSARARRSTSRR